MKKRADLIIFAGQSNMQGQSETLSDGSVVPGAFEYKMLGDALAPLCDPFGEDITYDGKPGQRYFDEMGPLWHPLHALGGSAYGHSTLAPSFCREYTEKTGKCVIAVSAAKGSTKLSDWLPGTPGYSFIVRKTDSARKKAAEDFDIDATYILWLQGESDAIEATPAEEYVEELKVFASSLRSDTGIARFGVIRVGRFTGDDRDDVIIGAQDEICKSDPFFLMLTQSAADIINDPACMNPRVWGHFSALGLAKLGKEAAATLASFDLSRLD